jgi:hypothetical protein
MDGGDDDIVLDIPHSAWGGSGGCTGGYSDDNIAILGTPLFRHYMVVFDMEGSQFRYVLRV